MKSRGLGDDIEKFTKITGIKKLVEKTNELLGTECNCSRRQEWVNNAVPYKNTEYVNPPMIEQNINDFCEGIYIFNNNVVLNRKGEVLNYKVGDKILINIENPCYNDFKQYYSLGILSKENGS